MPSFGQIAAAFDGPTPSLRRRASSETLVGDVSDSRASSVTAVGDGEGGAWQAPLVTFDDDEDADPCDVAAMHGESSFVYEAVEPARGERPGSVADAESSADGDGSAGARPVVDVMSDSELDAALAVGADDDDDDFAFEVVDRDAPRPSVPSVEDEQVFVDDDADRHRLDLDLEPDSDADGPEPLAPVAGPSRRRQPRHDMSPSLSPVPIPAAAKGKGKARSREYATARPAARSPEPAAPLTAEQRQLVACLKKGSAAGKQLKLAEAKEVRMVASLTLIVQWYRRALDHGLSRKDHDRLVAKLPAPGRGGAIAFDLPAAKPRRRESSSPRRPTWHASAAAPSRGKRAPAPKRR